MLVKIFPRLGEFAIIKYLKKGLDSKYSAFLIAAIILCSNLFSWEIPMMYALTGLLILATLFAEDMLCMLPFACGAYFTFSKVNNPLDYTHTSVFITEFGKRTLWIVALTVATFSIGRLVFELLTRKERKKFPLLAVGFIALGLSYVLTGFLTENYDLKTAFFGFTEIAALSFSYFYFYFTVDFKRVEKSYFAFLMTVMGLLLCGEVLGMLYQGGFFTTEGEFNRANLYTGWGIYNNVAGAMIMCIPAPFYYATTKKNGWLFLILGNVFYTAILFIQSRGGMLFGTCIYALCVLLTVWKAKRKLPLLLTQAGIWAIALCVCFFFQEKLGDMFYSIIQSGMNDSGRFDIYQGGFEQFLQAPVFGNGWYECGAFRWGDNSIGDFLPARYHNTVIQLIAAGGAFAILAYAFHRSQTLYMVFKRRTVEKYFIGLCVLGLLLTSLLDCHLFNFGPGMTYSALLLFLELEHRREEPQAPLERIPTPVKAFYVEEYAEGRPRENGLVDAVLNKEN